MVWGRYRWCNAHGDEHYRIQILAQEVNMLVARSEPNLLDKHWEQEARLALAAIFRMCQLNDQI